MAHVQFLSCLVLTCALLSSTTFGVCFAGEASKNQGETPDVRSIASQPALIGVITIFSLIFAAAGFLCGGCCPSTRSKSSDKHSLLSDQASVAGYDSTESAERSRNSPGQVEAIEELQHHIGDMDDDDSIMDYSGTSTLSLAQSRADSHKNLFIISSDNDSINPQQSVVEEGRDSLPKEPAAKRALSEQEQAALSNLESSESLFVDRVPVFASGVSPLAHVVSAPPVFEHVPDTSFDRGNTFSTAPTFPPHTLENVAAAHTDMAAVSTSKPESTPGNSLADNVQQMRVSVLDHQQQEKGRRHSREEESISKATLEVDEAETARVDSPAEDVPQQISILEVTEDKVAPYVETAPVDSPANDAPQQISTLDVEEDEAAHCVEFTAVDSLTEDVPQQISTLEMKGDDVTPCTETEPVDAPAEDVPQQSEHGTDIHEIGPATRLEEAAPGDRSSDTEPQNCEAQDTPMDISDPDSLPSAGDISTDSPTSVEQTKVPSKENTPEPSPIPAMNTDMPADGCGDTPIAGIDVPCNAPPAENAAAAVAETSEAPPEPAEDDEADTPSKKGIKAKRKSKRIKELQEKMASPSSQSAEVKTPETAPKPVGKLSPALKGMGIPMPGMTPPKKRSPVPSAAESSGSSPSVKDLAKGLGASPVMGFGLPPGGVAAIKKAKQNLAVDSDQSHDESVDGSGVFSSPGKSPGMAARIKSMQGIPIMGMGSPMTRSLSVRAATSPQAEQEDATGLTRSASLSHMTRDRATGSKCRRKPSRRHVRENASRSSEGWTLEPSDADASTDALGLDESMEC